MPARRLRRPVSAALALALAPAVVLPGIASPAAATSPPAVTASATRPALELIGQELFATGTTFRGTEVGGLSGLAWDADRREYVALSDDRGDIDPARFYTLSIDLSDGRLNEGDVRFRDVTTLTRPGGRQFGPGTVDPEGIAVLRDGRLVITSEGDASALIDPFVAVFGRDGRQRYGLPVAPPYRPVADASRGIRDNLAFESATITPGGGYLFTATENALEQDGPAATPDNGSPSRLLRYDLRSGSLDRTVVYRTGPVAAEPVPAGGFATNGLVELLALDRHTLLALERSFSVGVGNNVKIYLVDTSGATDVTGLGSIKRYDGQLVAARKTLVLDLGTLGITLDNLEGMTFGPRLADGRRSLILVSDNNFSGTQVTQFLAFAMSRD